MSKQRKAEQLRLATAAARAYHDAVTQTRAGYLEVMKHVLVANSEGIWGEENRTRSRFTIEAVASSATEKQSGHLGPGGSEGYELFDQASMWRYRKGGGTHCRYHAWRKALPCGENPCCN